MSALVALTNLCDAHIATGFEGSLCRRLSCSFPGMQVVAFSVGLIAFCLVDAYRGALHLKLDLLLSNQIALDSSVSTVSLSVCNRGS